MNNVSTKTLIDANEVRNALSVLVKDGNAVELRILNARTTSDKYPYTASGYFNDKEDLISCLSALKTAKGVYITIQPCHPDLLSRAYNRLRSSEDMKADKSSTQDEQITRYQWLPIDIDVKRPAGISSSDEEHEAALQFVRSLCQTLIDEGWPENSIVEADSGNGGHALIAIDLPNNAESSKLLQRVLQGLGKRFDTDSLHVDQTVFNAARIWKLYGTLACKGDDTKARPHRMSRIIKAPSEIQTVSRDMLESIAVPMEAPATKTTPKGTNKKEFSVEDFLAKHGIQTVSQEDYRGGTKWLLEQCPFCRETDKCACVYALADGKLGFSCSHNRCSDLHWKDFRRHYEPDYDDKKYVEYRPSSTKSNGNGHHNHDAPQDDPGLDETDFILDCLYQDEWGDALLFAHLFRDEAIYDHSEKAWYLFNGHHWQLDAQGQVKHLVSGQLASTYLRASAVVNLQASALDPDEDIEQLKQLKNTIKALTNRAFSLRKVSRNSNVLNFASSQEGMGLTSDKWDTNVWILPVQNGVVDLKTGKLRAGKPEDCVRTVSPTKWKGLNAPAPRWEQLLQQVFADRDEEERKALIAFLQRILGYGSTGMVNEEVFLVLYGEKGRNGKDTIVGSVNKVLGPLSGAVSNDVFLSKGNVRTAGSATPHLADLQGKRIAYAKEPESGERFNVAQVKEVTGGDPIPTRKLYGNPYSFDPTHLLLLLTNHKPHATAKDEAFWERLRMITFNMRFVDSPDPALPNETKPDKTLKTALIDEASGILAWLVRGCLDWQAQGLNAPKSVLSSVKEYQEEEDNIQFFLDECCIVKEGLTSRANTLYEKYHGFCKTGNMGPLSLKNFGSDMSKRFEKDKDRKGWYYKGIGIVTTDYDDPCDGSNNPSHPCDGTRHDPSHPVEPPIEPIQHNEKTECDGCDGRNTKTPSRSEKNSQSGNFTKTSVTSVTKHNNSYPTRQPVEPAQGPVTGQCDGSNNPSHCDGSPVTPESVKSFNGISESSRVHTPAGSGVATHLWFSPDGALSQITVRLDSTNGVKTFYKNEDIAQIALEK